MRIGEILLIISLLDRTVFTIGDAEITLLSIILFVATIAITYIISKFIIRTALNSILKLKKVKKEARFNILKIVHYILMFIGLWIAFNVLGIQLTALLAVAGIAGIVLGFGLQPIMSNFISGLILTGEGTVQVGDWVKINNQIGEVIDSGFRSSTIRTTDNLHIIVPNSKLVEESFTNYSHGSKKIRIRIPVGVKYGTNVEKVKKILLEIA